MKFALGAEQDTCVSVKFTGVVVLTINVTNNQINFANQLTHSHSQVHHFWHLHIIPSNNPIRDGSDVHFHLFTKFAPHPHCTPHKA